MLPVVRESFPGGGCEETLVTPVWAPTFLGSGSMRTINLCSPSIPGSKEQTRPNQLTQQLFESNAEP